MPGAGFALVEFFALGVLFGARVAERGAELAVRGLIAGEQGFGGGEEVVEGVWVEGVCGAVGEEGSGDVQIKQVIGGVVVALLFGRLWALCRC